jgi:phage terminase large subunit-like protein
MTNQQIAVDYANDCISDKIPSCVYVKKAAERFLKDLADERYFYDEPSVATVTKFINHLDLTEQETPKKFKLEPWQTFIIVNVYGLKRRDNGLRKYRYGYIELARKNGKSQLITALAMYHLLVDTDAQIVLSANSRDQIKNVDFKKVKTFASQLDPKQKHLIQYFNSIKYGRNELIVTAADSKRLDGLNASFCLIDELHSAPNNHMYNVLKSSQGGRTEPLFLTITTAGFDTESFCYQLRSYIVDILYNQMQDEQQFGLIYTLDADDDFADKSNWIKANPNIDVSVNTDFLSSEVIKATQNETERNGVLVKNFNRWLKASSIDNWIPEEYYNAALQQVSIDDFKGEECYVGIDLASVSDIAAVSYMFQKDDNVYYFNRYYVPSDNVDTNANRELYKEAAALGYLTITDGNVVDYDLILSDIIAQNEKTMIQHIYYDRFNSTQMTIYLTEQGFNSTPFAQTAGSLNRPLKDFERLIKSGKIIIERNSITRWMLSNIVLKINHYGNYSIDKSTRSKKIDGVSAMINALGGFLSNPNAHINIW